MKLPVTLLFFCFLTYAAAFVPTKTQHEIQASLLPDIVGPPALWFEQTLDHFGESSTTFKQKYFVNDTFFSDKNNPVFIYIGGEGPLAGSAVSAGEIAELAEKFSGLIVGLEHRFYGESQPFADLKGEHLTFLSSRQALADLAQLVDYIRDNYEATGKVISMGGSYAGAMSAWFRAVHPDKVDAAISVSSPVLAIDDYVQYDEVIVSALQAEKDGCYEWFVNVSAQINAKLATAEGQKQVCKDFNLARCPDFGDSFGWGAVTQYLPGDVMGSAQYNLPQLQYPLDQLCEWAISQPDPYTAWSGSFRQQQAYDYMDIVTTYTDTDITSEDAPSRAWGWQKCNEFGYFKDHTKTALWSPMCTLEYHHQLCEECYGQIPDIDATNKFYGGMSPDVDNVIYANGPGFDPWSSLSILKEKFPYYRVAHWSKEGHCAPMYVRTALDDPSVNEVRDQIEKFVADIVG